MRHPVTGLTVLALLTTTMAAPAAGQKQDIRTRGYFGIGGGGAVPVGNYADGAKTGFVTNLIAGFTTRGGILGARADFTWAQNRNKILDGNIRQLGLNADVVLTPGHRPNKFHPYFLAGAGIYNVHSSAAGVASTSETKPAFNVGTGVQVHLGHRTDLFVEGRYMTILTSGNNLGLIPISLGFRWGGI